MPDYLACFDDKKVRRMLSCLLEMNPNVESGSVCLHPPPNMWHPNCTASGDVTGARMYGGPKKTKAHLLRAPSDIRLRKGPESGFLFSHLSRLTFTLHVQTKASQKRGEHRIINIQLAGAAANDLFCCVSVLLSGWTWRVAIPYELQVKGCWNGEGYRNELLTTEVSHHPSNTLRW